jgi:hypothetical protein
LGEEDRSSSVRRGDSWLGVGASLAGQADEEPLRQHLYQGGMDASRVQRINGAPASCDPVYGRMVGDRLADPGRWTGCLPTAQERRFMNQMVQRSIQPARQRTTRYENALRERNRLLSNRPP